MNEIESFRLNASGRLVSRMGMGCWAIGGHGWGEINDEESIQAIRHAFERGVTFFDTADVYGFGKSERILRQALGENLKDLFLASKGGVCWDESGKVWNDSSPAYLKKAAEASLKRLGIERIPLYYIHKLDGKTPVTEIMAALLNLQDQGKIGGIGVSNFTASDLAEALTVTPVQAIQVQFNLLRREHGQALASLCSQFNILLVAWGTLADGLLTGKFDHTSRFSQDDHRSRLPAFQGESFLKNLRRVDHLRKITERIGVSLSQLALRWIMDKYDWACPLFGAKTAAQVEENLGAMGWNLSLEDMLEVEKLASEML
jgi:aryl-alcohol dehydrogenase-like predicted oxidoreductase